MQTLTTIGWWFAGLAVWTFLCWIAYEVIISVTGFPRKVAWYKRLNYSTDTFWGKVGFVFDALFRYIAWLAMMTLAIILAIIVIMIVAAYLADKKEKEEKERKRLAEAAEAERKKSLPPPKPSLSYGSSDYSSSYESSASDASPNHESDDSEDESKPEEEDMDRYKRSSNIDKCYDCNGEQNHFLHGDIGDGKCSECQGDGHPPFFEDDPCHKCGGSGDCPSCDGKGFNYND